MSEPVSISNAIANKKFNSNAHPPINDFQSDVNFTDLDVFTQGQPFDHFKKMGSCCEKAVTKLQSSLVLIASSKSVTLARTLTLKLDT